MAAESSQSINTSHAGLPDPLLDVQGLGDQRGVDLQQVGVRSVEMPIQVLQKDGKVQPVAASATLSVGLSREHKGTHMSRFIIQLNEWRKDHVFTLKLREYLAEAQKRLNSSSAFMEIAFKYFIEKAGPASGLAAPMAYECVLKGSLKTDATQRMLYRSSLLVRVPICTLCPCSKAISDYGAHNQRAIIEAEVLLDAEHEDEHAIVWIEDLVQQLEAAASCPVYPLVKREDEKWMTEWAYDHPKFVEDVIRESILSLRAFPGVKGFAISVEALESIHGHNAWTAHQEHFVPVSQ